MTDKPSSLRKKLFHRKNKMSDSAGNTLENNGDVSDASSDTCVRPDVNTDDNNNASPVASGQKQTAARLPKKLQKKAPFDNGASSIMSSTNGTPMSTTAEPFLPTSKAAGTSIVAGSRRSARRNARRIERRQNEPIASKKSDESLGGSTMADNGSVASIVKSPTSSVEPPKADQTFLGKQRYYRKHKYVEPARENSDDEGRNEDWKDLFKAFGSKFGLHSPFPIPCGPRAEYTFDPEPQPQLQPDTNRWSGSPLARRSSPLPRITLQLPNSSSEIILLDYQFPDPPEDSPFKLNMGKDEVEYNEYQIDSPVEKNDSAPCGYDIDSGNKRTPSPVSPIQSNDAYHVKQTSTSTSTHSISPLIDDREDAAPLFPHERFDTTPAVPANTPVHKNTGPLDLAATHATSQPIEPAPLQPVKKATRGGKKARAKAKKVAAGGGTSDIVVGPAPQMGSGSLPDAMHDSQAAEAALKQTLDKMKRADQQKKHEVEEELEEKEDGYEREQQPSASGSEHLTNTSEDLLRQAQFALNLGPRSPVPGAQAPVYTYSPSEYSQSDSPSESMLDRRVSPGGDRVMHPFTVVEDRTHVIQPSGIVMGGYRRWRCCKCGCFTHYENHVCSNLSCMHNRCETTCEQHVPAAY